MSPNAVSPARIPVLAFSVPPDGCFPARIVVLPPSVPPNACFPAPPPTGCHGRRLRHAAAVGSVQWPSSRRPLPRDVQSPVTGIPARMIRMLRPRDVKSRAECVPAVNAARHPTTKFSIFPPPRTAFGRQGRYFCPRNQNKVLWKQVSTKTSNSCPDAGTRNYQSFLSIATRGN